MQNPYALLGVTDESSDDDIKLAYLQKVKETPPDRDQEAFQRMHQAYTSIKDRHSRVRYALFHLPDVAFDDLLDTGFNLPSVLPLRAEQFSALLNASVTDLASLSAKLKTKS